MFQVSKFEFNHIQVNCYIVWDAETHDCAIVDPGMSNADETATLTQYIEQNGLNPKLILLTHGHVDHVAGLREVCKRYGLPATTHRDSEKLLQQAEIYASMLGFQVQSLADIETHFVDDNDCLSLGNGSIECRYVPGHCPGSICYVLHDEKTVLTGDAIFHFSIGRTDLPGGDFDLLVEKLQSRILTLPDDYCILPGHGIPSMVWKEKKYNPFLK